VNKNQKTVYFSMVIFLFFITLAFSIIAISALWEHNTNKLIASTSSLVVAFLSYGMGFNHGRAFQRSS
jgi:hypothetical protein